MSVPIRIAAACCLAIITGLSGGCERRPPTIEEVRGKSMSEIRTVFGEPIESLGIPYPAPEPTGDAAVDNAASENAKRYSRAMMYVYGGFKIVFNDYDEVIAVE